MKMKMLIKLLNESGYDQALYGLSLPFRTAKKNLPNVALKLKDRGHGHNKFLEHLTVWLSIKAPLFWWKQFDTYRVGVSKQSESTMHKGLSRQLTQEDFSEPLPQAILDHLNNLIQEKDFRSFNNVLPSGFLQERMVLLSYKTIREIIIQRRDHKLKEWDYLINFFYQNLEHSELLPDNALILEETNDEIKQIKKIIADLAKNSNDPNTKVGAYIALDGKIIGQGWNRMPGFNDNFFPWTRPEKYYFVCHAEMLALFSAFKLGYTDFSNAILYSSHLPCSQCTKYLLDVGLTKHKYFKVGNLDISELQAGDLLFDTDSKLGGEIERIGELPT